MPTRARRCCTGHMRRLIADPAVARALSGAAARIARAQLGINRIVADWCDALAEVTGFDATQPERAHA